MFTGLHLFRIPDNFYTLVGSYIHFNPFLIWGYVILISFIKIFYFWSMCIWLFLYIAQVWSFQFLANLLYLQDIQSSLLSQFSLWPRCALHNRYYLAGGNYLTLLHARLANRVERFFREKKIGHVNVVTNCYRTPITKFYFEMLLLNLAILPILKFNQIKLKI